MGSSIDFAKKRDKEFESLFNYQTDLSRSTKRYMESCLIEDPQFLKS